MVAKKRKSKRQTLQVKYKIQKRTKEHHKRLKKGAIVNSGPKGKTRDTIPNAWPYKEDLLKEIRTAKDRMEEAKLRAKDKRREESNKSRGIVDKEDAEEGEDESGSEMDEDESEVDAPDLVEADEDGEDNNDKSLGQNSRRAYLKELRKVVEKADVILQVLDARDPLGTLSTTVEDMVLAKSGKRLVYVLNKADLVPRDVLVSWLQFLRASHPTIPFKSNTQQQKGNLSQGSGKVAKQTGDTLQNSRAVGGEELLGLLKNYCRSGDTKTLISVGIVGFPNVGKSSLINSLLRTRAMGVSPTPGFTKQNQEVILDKNIRLIDSPGIVFADGDTTATALRNCVNVEDMIDVYTPVQGILERCPAQYLMQLYSITKYADNDPLSFLALVAKATGKLKKGGIANTDAAARVVLHDWNTGKIKYYCRPPAAPVAKKAKKSKVEEDSKMLSGFSAVLDINNLKDEDIRVLQDLYPVAANATADQSEFFVGIDKLGDSIDMPKA
jgi:nuclear GTP-binding protein